MPSRRYLNPKCVCEFPDGRVCGHEMKPVDERHPYAAHYRQSPIWVFHCGYCDAYRAIDTSRLDHLAERA